MKRERSGVYPDLYLAVERSEAKAEVFHLKNIETASVKNCPFKHRQPKTIPGSL